MKQKNEKQLDILEQQTELEKLSAELELFIVKSTDKNINAMMSKINGNTEIKHHLDIQRTLDLAKKTAGIVPYYPAMSKITDNEESNKSIKLEIIGVKSSNSNT